jgi:spore coat protein U-like protein
MSTGRQTGVNKIGNEGAAHVMKRRLILGAISAIALALPAASQAGTATTTIAVTANIPQGCTVNATALAFGNYSVASGTSGTSNITVTCLASTAYTIDLDAGTNGTLNGTSTTRALASGLQLLAYNLFTDAAHSKVWATGTGADVNGTANLTTVTPVYGFIPASQTAGPGAYTDTVNVTVSY